MSAAPSRVDPVVRAVRSILAPLTRTSVFRWVAPRVMPPIESAIVAGTSFAREHHPAWTYNLLAYPEAEISVRGRRYAVRAFLIEADAREQAWRRIESQGPGYRASERESGRTVRLFRLRLLRELGVGS